MWLSFRRVAGLSQSQLRWFIWLGCHLVAFLSFFFYPTSDKWKTIDDVRQKVHPKKTLFIPQIVLVRGGVIFWNYRPRVVPHGSLPVQWFPSLLFFRVIFCCCLKPENNKEPQTVMIILKNNVKFFQRTIILTFLLNKHVYMMQLKQIKTLPVTHWQDFKTAQYQRSHRNAL